MSHGESFGMPPDDRTTPRRLVMLTGAIAGAFAAGAWILDRTRAPQATTTSKSAILWIAVWAGYFIVSMAMPYARLRWAARTVCALNVTMGVAILVIVLLR